VNRATRHWFALLVVAASATALTAGRQSPQRPAFVTGVDVVTIDVSVHQGNLAVTGLGPDDFEVTDNGVPQTVDAVALDTRPVDLSLVIDASGSTEPFIDQLKKDAREAAGMLREDDRMRLIAFTVAVTQVSEFQPADGTLILDRPPALVLTSIYDAVGAALMRTRTPDRRDLIVVFTDGYDNSSTLSGATLLDLARRSDAILHVFIARPTEELLNVATAGAHANSTRGYWRPFNDVPLETSRVWLGDAAATTGGQLQDIVGEAHVPRGLKVAIDDMRTSYILQYTTKSVPRPGWHEIKVTLKRRADVTIRARKGYFASGADR
jgi:Ca-activated chloride channel family protein